MTKRQRKILAKLCDYTNMLGGTLDGTSTNEAKYRDRQQANMLTYRIVYGVLCDSAENEYREEDFAKAEEALEEMRLLTLKSYPDRQSYYSKIELEYNEK